MNHFAALRGPEDVDYDGDGLTDLQEYNGGVNGTDPNTIAYWLDITNQYVRSGTVSLQVDLTGGQPASKAILVDSTNFSTATWSSYTSSNLTANIGTTEGWHTVWVGLRGRQTTSEQTWHEADFKLDLTPPTVTITNPSPLTTARPIIQIQGYGNEPLGGIYFCLTNAVSSLTNEQAFVTGQVLNTNTMESTTNYFQCFDVELADGKNQITLRVPDLAGNVTTNIFTVTLDVMSNTNAPAVNVIWPQEGMQLSGTNFTLRGRMDDETAKIQASIVDGDGVTNAVEGLVERGGMFWLENLPLGAGTNIVTLTATNAGNRGTNLTLTVFKSTVELTIISAPGDESLYSGSVTVSGRVDPTYSVTVNGATATVNGTGYWTASAVPVKGTAGTATFDASAVGGGGTASIVNASVEKDKPAMLVVGSYEMTIISETRMPFYCDFYSRSTTHKKYESKLEPDECGTWKQSYSGTMTVDSFSTSGCGSSANSKDYSWSDTDPIGTEHYVENREDVYVPITVDYNEDLPTSVPHATFDNVVLGYSTTYVGNYSAEGVANHWDSGLGTISDISVSAKTGGKLYTGGKARFGAKCLFGIDLYAGKYGKAKEPGWYYTPGKGIDPQSTKILGKSPGADGKLWIALPEGSEQEATVIAAARHVNAGAGVTKYHPYVSANGHNLEKETPEFCVGQEVTFALNWDPAAPSGVLDTIQRWTLPDKFVNESYQYSPTCSSYRRNDNLLTQNPTSCWYVNKPGGNVSMWQNLHFANGKYASIAAKGKLTIYRPTPPFSGFSCLMHTFAYSSPTLYADMRWEATVSVDPKYSGSSSIGITQLIKGSLPFYPTGGEWGRATFFL